MYHNIYNFETFVIITEEEETEGSKLRKGHTCANGFRLRLRGRNLFTIMHTI